VGSEMFLRDRALAARESTGAPPDNANWRGTGRELFAAFRRQVGPADRGASVIGPDRVEIAS
jgi:phosphogluconate dehydratase